MHTRTHVQTHTHANTHTSSARMHTRTVAKEPRVEFNLQFWCRTRFGTRLRKCIGCLKFLFFFRKRANTHRALLLQMTYKDKARYTPLSPCRSKEWFNLRSLLVNVSTHGSFLVNYTQPNWNFLQLLYVLPILPEFLPFRWKIRKSSIM